MKTKKMKKQNVNLTRVEDEPILIAKRDIRKGEIVEVKMRGCDMSKSKEFCRERKADEYLESKDFKPFKKNQNEN